MICPQCQTSNPDQAETCTACRHSLSDRGVSARAPEADFSSTPTVAGPTTLKEWARVEPSPPSQAISLVLPQGLEIGHRYHVVRLLGIGGMGAVYRVHDGELDRDVALKLIRSDIAEDTSTLERFKREIQLSSRVTHKNVLRVYDLGQSDGIKFLTMQFVEGEDFSSILKREGKVSIPRILHLFRQICEGLLAAHEQGVIHRDLKPQNIMVDAADNVFVMDFGLAKSLEQSAMTQAGAVLGTPYYMSPEQVKGEPIDGRSDIYSLGIILYEMATGALPYTGRTPYEVMIQRTQRPPRPAEEINPEIPTYLRKILARCLCVDPALRYASVGEILTDLTSGSFRPTLRYQIRRQRRLVPAAVGVAVLAVLVFTGLWLYRTGRAAKPVTRKPESVLIADFVNHTGDPVLDGTLESAFSIAMEGASFLTSYNRSQARKIAAQLQPGSSGLDETLARLVAVREGVSVVTSGSVDRQGNGYGISVRAIEAATGKPIVTNEERASGKEEVLSSVAKLAAHLRAALGDATPRSAQLAAAETFTAGSLEAAHEYGVAQDLQWAGNWDEAIRHYRKAIDLDPNLGRAYAGLAAVESNRGRRQDAEKEYKQALSHIDRMSDREKYRTRGGYYLLTRNPENAIEEFSALVQRYPADTAGIANLAAAYFYKRDMARALEKGRRAIEIYPKNVPQRNNVGLYAMYAGDFDTAIREQNEVLRLNPRFVLAYVGMALSQLAQGHPDLAAGTYRKVKAIDARGASVAAAGLADIALYQGRPADAVAILERGIEADLAGKDSDSAAAKLLALADARLRLRQTGPALEAADRALSMSRGENVLYPAARVYLEAGREPKARALAAELAARLEPDPQAYGELILGEAEFKRGKTREAIRRFEAARKIADTWMGRFDIGRAYLEAEAFPQADTELETCLKRRGEATALFLDEVPTYRLFPPVYYYLGRAQQGLKSPAAADSYKAFLSIKGSAGRDPLVADARSRLAGP